MARSRLAAILSIALLPAAAPAQPRACGPHDQLRSSLDERHGEARRAAGLTADGQAMMELYAAPESGSWTILVVLTDGRACLLAAGSAFQALAPPAPGDDRAALDGDWTLRF